MKATEAHKMTDDEINLELNRLQRHLFDLKSQSVTQKLEDPSQLLKTRRDIARLHTERRSRQIAKQAGAK
jgi:large subunit ribosomal protein L29